ncbi:phage shock protein A (PspA) family protein [Marinomonas balearica]|uniref:Phage shock protein A (PspA) family protein n=2 Tax=Marinomonas balearica TaxID=491947 RepID=A0A4R6MIH4_9GAMM|nr:phage shock protein A (PspA) family protein [Marinomonas balearica]
MNIFSKLFTALKGGASEMGEAVVDDNAIRILEQELRESKASLDLAKESEITLLASQKQAEAKIAKLSSQIEEYENNAFVALKQNNEALALEIAHHIATLEAEQKNNKDQAEHFAKSAHTLRSQIQKAETDISDFYRQLEQVKATDSVHKAQENMHANILTGKPSVASAKESLERIRNKQEHFEARLEASQELESRSTLDEKLKNAGITLNVTSAQNILDKIKTRAE